MGQRQVLLVVDESGLAGQGQEERHRLHAAERFCRPYGIEQSSQSKGGNQQNGSREWTQRGAHGGCREQRRQPGVHGASAAYTRKRRGRNYAGFMERQLFLSAAGGGEESYSEI